MRSAPFLCLLVCLAHGFGTDLSHAMGDDPVFSGPQPGEAVTPFQIVSAQKETLGKKLDPIAEAGGKPTLLVFVHKLTRPGMALTRGLTAYAKSLEKHDARSAIIWLDDDQSKAEAYLTRAAKSLNFNVTIGVSVDGGEGPGAYGLNRNVELTILIAKDNVVTANFALVQPSVSESGKIAEELAKLVDQPAPTNDQIEKFAYPGAAMAGAKMRRRPNARPTQDAATKPGQPSKDGSGTASDRPAGELRSLMRAVINADDKDLKQAVQAVNRWVGDQEPRKRSLRRMSAAVLERKLGSADAQKAIRQWLDQDGDQDR